MSDEDTIECAEHGTGRATFVCQHFANGGRDLGFHWGHSEDDPDGLWPDAWCDACEAVLVEEGGWNERAEASAAIRLLCDACYEHVRADNWLQDERAWDELLHSAIDYLHARQEHLQSRFRLDEYEKYGWDQDTAELVFYHEDRPRVVADIQFVGSVSRRSNTFMWSWGNRSIAESNKDRVRRVRTYGEEHGFLKLASAVWTAEEEDGWEMTAVTALLLGAAGAYRSPDDYGSSFLVMTDIRWIE